MTSGVLALTFIKPIVVHIYGLAEVVNVGCEALMAGDARHSAPVHLPIHFAVDCLAAVAEWAVEGLLKFGSSLCKMNT